MYMYIYIYMTLNNNIFLGVVKEALNDKGECELAGVQCLVAAAGYADWHHIATNRLKMNYSDIMFKGTVRTAQ